MPAGGWVFSWFSTGRQGVSVGFRLVGGFFGRKSTGGEWSACLWAKLVGAWLRGGCWCWAGGSLACVPHVYTGWASADRGSGSESVYVADRMCVRTLGWSCYEKPHLSHSEERRGAAVFKCIRSTTPIMPQALPIETSLNFAHPCQRSFRQAKFADLVS